VSATSGFGFAFERFGLSFPSGFAFGLRPTILAACVTVFVLVDESGKSVA